MRKSRYRLYNHAFLVVLAIDLLLCYTVFRTEAKMVKDAFWENPWFGLIGGVLLQGLLAVFFMAMAYELGRKKGLKELGGDMLVDPDDYLDLDDDDERIMVTEKFSRKGIRRTFAKILRKRDLE